MGTMKTIGLLNLSNPCSKERVQDTIDYLESLGFEVKISPYLYLESTAQERAEVFNSYMKEEIPFIFDVSGGDLANGTIPYLDLEAYKNSSSIFHGYSDLTCVLNVLAPLRSCVLFQICQNTNLEEIKNYLLGKDNHLFVQSSMGGNIRCLLKLAGTPYFPDLKGQSLFLESRSGNWKRIESYLVQLEMMGIFHKVQSLTFGQFTELSQLGEYDKLKDKDWGIPVSFIDQVGHSKDSFAIRLEMK